MSDLGRGDRVPDVRQPAAGEPVQQKLGDRAMRLEVQDRAAEDALEGRHGDRARNGGGGRREQQQAEVGKKVIGNAAPKRRLDPLGQKRSLEGIGGAGDQDEHVEQGEGNGDPPCADACDPDGIGQCADKLDHECQRAEADQLPVHGRNPASNGNILPRLPQNLLLARASCPRRIVVAVGRPVGCGQLNIGGWQARRRPADERSCTWIICYATKGPGSG